MKTALIILGHGSRDPEAIDTLVAITSMVGKQVNYERVEYASLQLSKPALPDVIEELYGAGIRRILVVPFLIATGVHVKTDIPQELAALSHKYPGLTLVLGDPLGADPRLADIVVDRVTEMEQKR
jgi:sirohydrochlorin ferrochelatase